MGRQPRFRIPGYPQHIVQRGNNRQPCFLSDRDYSCYLNYLFTASLKFKCDVHAYVLMTNHVHLLVTPNTVDGIPDLMQAIGRRYVKMFNSRYERTGTLWEGRYKSTLVDTDEYLLACYRYIELNPVRAGLVSDPSLYPWSSYGAHAGGRDDQLIRDHGAFLNLGDKESVRSNAYRRLFDSELSKKIVDEIRVATRKSRPLGDIRINPDISSRLGQAFSSKQWGGSRLGAGRPKGSK